MPITRTAWTDDDGSGTTGTIINNAVKTELYDQIDAAIAAAVGTHTLLNGVTHSDTVGQTVNRGSIIVGNATPKWTELNLGTAGQVLTSNGSDIVWAAAAAGTVSSVGLSVPGFLSVTGSPVTTAGTLAVALATQSANAIFAGPVSGGAAAPTFRAMVVADLVAHGNASHTSTFATTGDLTAAIAAIFPIDLASEVTGNLPVGHLDGGTAADGTTFWRGDGVWAIPPGGGGGGGSVNSVGMTVPGFLSVTGSPITSSGTLAVSLATQAANLIFAGPVSGGSATPTFRSLVAADLAALLPIDLPTQVTGDLPDANLSANVPLLNATNAFTGANSFATNPLSLLVGQLAFPSTQNASSNVNTLDDYEEGSWTPVIGGVGGTSGQTYVGQNGSYVKIGKAVFLTLNVVLSVKGTITGNVQITGLPFTSANVASAAPLYWGAFNTTWATVQLLISGSVTSALVRGAKIPAIASSTSVTGSDLTDNTQIVGAICYIADN